MTVIGVTGNFGTGKTFVASVFKSLGAKVLDADRIAHNEMNRGTVAYRKIVKYFGRGILDESGDIDRKKLGAAVFKNKKDLAKLNRIVHPQVIAFIKEQIKKSKKNDIMVVDAPLLIEANITGIIDHLVVVKCSRQIQISRCMEKFEIAKKDVLNRIRNQIPLKRKVELADFVVDNDRSRAETRRQVIEIWRKVWK